MRRGGEEESAKSALNRFQKFAQLTDERGDLDTETANQMQFPRYIDGAWSIPRDCNQQGWAWLTSKEFIVLSRLLQM